MFDDVTEGNAGDTLALAWPCSCGGNSQVNAAADPDEPATKPYDDPEPTIIEDPPGEEDEPGVAVPAPEDAASQACACRAHERKDAPR